MNPLSWSFRSNYLLGFLACTGLLSFALYAEYWLGMSPCPLCVFQRIGFVAMGVFFLAGAVHGPRGAGRWVYAVFADVAALAGAATAVRHLWLQSLPPDQVPSCGPGIGYLFDAFPLATMLRKVFTGSGECATVEPILGVPMPAWSLLWFVALGALALLAAWRCPRRSAMVDASGARS